jgi:4-hydroxy-3-methylbut-2-enyl diphosphate reductase
MSAHNRPPTVPEILVQEVASWLLSEGYGDLKEITHTEERLVFALPQELGKEPREERIRS